MKSLDNLEIFFFNFLIKLSENRKHLPFCKTAEVLYRPTETATTAEVLTPEEVRRTSTRWWQGRQKQECEGRWRWGAVSQRRKGGWFQRERT